MLAEERRENNRGISVSNLQLTRSKFLEDILRLCVENPEQSLFSETRNLIPDSMYIIDSVTFR